MLRKLAVLLMISFIFASCSKTDENKPEEESSVQTIALADFFGNNTLDLAGKEVYVEGNVVHTCKNSGKKMFLVDNDGNNKFRIDAGDEIAEFKTELEGKKVKVFGIVEEERIDENYLAEWEKEIKAEGESEAIGEGACAEEQPESFDEEKSQQENQMNRINELREQIAKSGKGYISFYSLKASKYEEIK